MIFYLRLLYALVYVRDCCAGELKPHTCDAELVELVQARPLMPLCCNQMTWALRCHAVSLVTAGSKSQRRLPAVKI